MAIIRRNDLKKMSPEETKTRIVQLERTLLELESENKHEKKKPVKKAIAKLKTLMSKFRIAANTSALKKR